MVVSNLITSCRGVFIRTIKNLFYCEWNKMFETNCLNGQISNLFWSRCTGKMQKHITFYSHGRIMQQNIGNVGKK